MLRGSCADHRRVVLGLDFDGTLSPLVLRPASARLPAETRRLLSRLAADPRVSVAIISGRALADIKGRVGLRKLHYSGNHGLEIEGPGVSWRHPAARRAAGQVRRLSLDLASCLAGFPGILVENKGLTLSVHHRAMPPALEAGLRKAVLRAGRSFSSRLTVSRGKKILEFRPKVRWNKGHALLRIARLHGPGGLILFVGDDRTDEDGFRVLGRRAVTVKVGGAAHSHAHYRIANQSGVLPFLKFLERRIGAMRG